MGSQHDLPPASSPSLILTHPTAAESQRIWESTHPNWGPALSLQDYLEREAYLTKVPGAKDGGLTSWILTDSTLPPDQRPILSSCDTLRKRALVCAADGSGAPPTLRDGAAHGIGSVFTAPEFRGRGYASRMMREVGTTLKTWQAGSLEADGTVQQESTALFSVLYSDIGKAFYAKHGWPAYESTHVSWAPTPPGGGGGTEGQDNSSSTPRVQPIGYHELAELCAIDECLLREHLPQIAAGPSSRGRPAVALVPDLETMLWHLMREDFMCSHIFPDRRTPSVRGAVAGEPGRRVWAVWTRAYYGGLRRPEGNTLHILRVVVEDGDETPSEELVRGFRAIVEMARREAGEWQVEEVQLWNPSGVVRMLVGECGVPGSWVVREEESIASLMWYGPGGEHREVEWVANHKFGWC